RAVHTACMYFEGIAVAYPEYNPVLRAHRSQFRKWYEAMQSTRPIFDHMPPLVAKAIHSYYHRVVDPTSANVEGFFAVMTELQGAIESGEIQIEDEGIKQQLENNQR